MYDLSERAQHIFDLIIDSYLTNGSPVGSRTLSKIIDDQLSPATIRNVMADLQDMGLIISPHTSSGRIPTEIGLQYYVQGLMGNAALSDKDRTAIEKECENAGKSAKDLFTHTSRILSDLSSCTSLIAVPTTKAEIRHIEFVYLEPGKALAVLVSQDGHIENRMMSIDKAITRSALRMASNYLQDRLIGNTLSALQDNIMKEIETQRAQLDELTTKVVQAGLAMKPNRDQDVLIVQRSAELLKDADREDLEKIEKLFEKLDDKETASELLAQADTGEAIQIFIGSQNTIFEGSDLIMSFPKDKNDNIVGAVCVLGPQRLNYRRIIPLVDYTARIMARTIRTISE